MPCEMASSSLLPWLSYQRLKKLPARIGEEGTDDVPAVAVGVVRRRRWWRIGGGRRQRRLRVRVPSFRRLLRKKAGAAKSVAAKVFKRLMEGRPYVGELFAGNYMFMQVSLACSSSSTSTLQKKIKSLPAHQNNQISTKYPDPTSAKFSIHSILA